MNNLTNLKAEFQVRFSSVLPKKGHELHDIAEFHFKDFGKLLRGSSSLAISNAVNLNTEASINWALSVELMHNASLVHDDVCDNDSHRRQNLTVFAKFGPALAICFGDWLVAKSFEHAVISINQSGKKSNDAIILLSSVMANLSKGQAREFIGKPVLDWDSYNNLVNGKTTPLLAAAIEGPFLLANEFDHLDDIRNIIQALGMSYQISNDILDVLGKDGSSMAFNDLMRKAPNAVSITFRDKLKNGHKIDFDRWMRNSNSDTFVNWSDEIKNNGAIESCVGKLNHYLQISDHYLSKLPDTLQDALLPIITYLESTSKNMCPSNNKL